jgi:hypothetical protein
MLKKQCIAILFASVLLANLGHNIVPHQHHIGCMLSAQDCCNRETDKSAFHPVDLRSNCHAFNGIDYYPAPENQVISKPFNTAKYIRISQAPELCQAISHREIYHSFKGSPPVFTYLLGSSSGLRAPPVAS